MQQEAFHTNRILKNYQNIIKISAMKVESESSRETPTVRKLRPDQTFVLQ